MSISKTKNYLVLNYGSSPVAVKTKYDSFLVEGGTLDEPGTLPLTIDEISVVNSNSPAFKIGLLRFESEYEIEIYDELRITNWKEILTNSQIEDIILHPSVDTLQKILNIENDAYFERVRGVFMGLKNAGSDISNKVEKIIDMRRQEFIRRQRKSAIQLTPTVVKNDVQTPSQEEFNSLKDQLAEMQSMIEKLTSLNVPVESPTKPTIDTQDSANLKSTRKTTRTTSKK